MNLEMEGMDELLKQLEALEAKGDEIKNKAVDKGTDYFQEKLKENVYSHGLTKRTGEAERSIKRSSVKDGEAEVFSSGKGFYLKFHEIGFYNVRARRYITARPVVGPTYQKERGNVERVMAQEAKKELGL